MISLQFRMTDVQFDNSSKMMDAMNTVSMCCEYDPLAGHVTYDMDTSDKKVMIRVLNELIKACEYMKEE